MLIRRCLLYDYQTYALGVERLNVFVSQFPRWKRLKQFELKIYTQNYTDGWEVSTTLKNERINLRILITSDFPFKPSRLAIYPSPPSLVWPHLEAEGMLCLMPESTPCSVENIEAVTRYLLREAISLISACLCGVNFNHFDDEFQSYWHTWSLESKNYYSLCANDTSSRWIYTCNFPKYRLVADDIDSIKKWINDFGFNPRRCPIESMPLIHIGTPLRPSAYPKTFKDFLSILKDDHAAQETVQNYITFNYKSRKQFLLSFKHQDNVGFAGLLLPLFDESLAKRRTALTIPPKSNGLEQIGNGFRHNKKSLPFDIFLNRYSVIPIKGATVIRCDSSWVHGRDHNPTIPTLQSKTVVMIGAGSLGSGIIELLAKAGLRKIIIVDPENLASENVCRHTLGVSSVGLKKASELKTLMSKRLPHLEFENYLGGWEHMYARTPQRITSADLLISTVGSWKIESHLNALARTTEDFPPVLFGWLEPHASAAHAVAFLDKGCLRCMTDDMGIPSAPITQWTEKGTLLQVPMCGGMFQPYGAIELSHGQSLVADLALDILLGHVTCSKHNVWIGQKKLLTAGNGNWNPEWMQKNGVIGNGGEIRMLDFKATPDCPICKGLK